MADTYSIQNSVARPTPGLHIKSRATKFLFNFIIKFVSYANSEIYSRTNGFICYPIVMGWVG